MPDLLTRPEDEVENPLVPDDDSVNATTPQAELDNLSAEQEMTPSFLRGIDPASKSDALETDALNKRLGGIQDDIGSGTDYGGFFKKTSEGRGGFISSLKGFGSNRRALLGVTGGGALGMMLVAGGLLSYLHTFKLDNFFKNVESRSAQRLMASIDTRNRYLVRSYIAVRVTEIEGGTANDNLFFKANKVDTQSPFSDWYRTMRNSKFESDLLNGEGIAFTSMVDKDGHINIAKVTGKDAVNPKLAATYLNKLKPDGSNFVDVLNSIPTEDMEKIFTVSTFDNHAAARASVREVVSDRVPWWRTFKRRHARQDIANVTGIKSWRLFEKTRDTIAKKRQDIKDRLLNKIIERYYVNNPSSAQFLKCLFSNGRCSTNSDPAAPDNKVATPAEGDELAGSDTQNETDAEGNKKATDSGTSAAGNEIDDAIKGAVEDGVSQETADAAESTALELTPGQKIITALINTITGNAVSESIPVNPTKVWAWAKRIYTIDSLIHIDGNGVSKVSKLVMNSRRAQLEGIYATYATANDQMKSGKLVGDQLNDFFDTTKNISNTEGWDVVTGRASQTIQKVGAEGTSNPTKEAYCKKPADQRDPNAFAWFCDDQKPNSGGRADAISDVYNQTIGQVMHPIAEVVKAVNDSVIGGILDFANSFIDRVVSTISGPAIEALMGSGVGKDLKKFMGTLMLRLLSFLGAGPMFDGTQAGLGNMLIAGAAAQSEGSIRASGGIRQTPATREYNDKLAINYAHQAQAKLSLYDRYASLSNPKSLASSTMFAIASNTNASNLVGRLSDSIASIPRFVGLVFSGRAFADPENSPNEVAEWAGVDRYDIPQQCQSLDPLDPNYTQLATNAGSVIPDWKPVDMATLRDTTKFSEALYKAIGKKENAQELAEKVYNCALLDARVMGSTGAVYGYTADNAYNAGASSAGTNNPNQDGSLGVAPDGFVFPLKTTKATLTNHRPQWCYTNLTNCHHDYNAADIFSDTGTVVVAPTNGTIKRVTNASGGTGSRITMQSDKGFIFYFAHLGKDTITVSEGDVVTAGTPLGKVGTTADAMGTTPHLHFDALASPPATARPSCAGATCAQYPFLPVQPALVAAFGALPD